MDKIEIYRDKLTPSAKEALTETMHELQDQIIEKANSIAQKGQTADKEISLRDIIEAKEELFKPKLEKEKSEFRRKRMMYLISLSGGMYSIVGMAIYFFQNKTFSIEHDLGLIIAFLGVFTIFFGFVYSQYFSRRYELKSLEVIAMDKDDNDFDIIKRWQIIERLGSNLMRRKGHSPNESKSINDILKFLSLELESDKLYFDLRELLQIRNKILHESYQMNRQEKHDLINKADKIIDILEKQDKMKHNN